MPPSILSLQALNSCSGPGSERWCVGQEWPRADGHALSVWLEGGHTQPWKSALTLLADSLGAGSP